jgi:hypothetical protein
MQLSTNKNRSGEGIHHKGPSSASCYGVQLATLFEAVAAVLQHMLLLNMHVLLQHILLLNMLLCTSFCLKIECDHRWHSFPVPNLLVTH